MRRFPRYGGLRSVTGGRQSASRESDGREHIPVPCGVRRVFHHHHATPGELALMTLARRDRLTVYDAAYLELALRERLDLATLDENLAEAARREGVAGRRGHRRRRVKSRGGG